MSYVPTEHELHTLGFRTNSPAQPFPTRAYFVALPSGNFLSLTPRPGMRNGCEFTVGGKLVAKHWVDTLQDLHDSVRGEGRRETV